MAYNIFFDTNILIDFFLPDRKGHNEAVILINSAEKGLVNICVSESVINTTEYVVRKSIYINEFQKAILELNDFIKILPCSNNIIHQAYKNSKNDLEDSVLYQIALHGRMDYFITSDIKDYKKLSHPLLPVVTAKKILDILNP